MLNSSSRPRVHSVRAGLGTWLLVACLAGCDRDASTATKTFPERPVADAPVTTDALSDAGAAPLVVFLGDSISAGLQLPAAQAFPALVASELAKQGTPLRLVNAGVSGDTSAGGLRRVSWLLKQRPAIVVIELGGNDGLRGQPVEELEKNLRAIVQRVQESGATPLLLGMILPPSYGGAYAEAFAAVYPRIASDLSVAFVPAFMAGVAGVPSLNFDDGIHPTAAGHERLALRVLPALRGLLVVGD